MALSEEEKRINKAIADKRWNENNRERKNINNKRWADKNRERVLSNQKKYRENNKEKIAAGNKRWGDRNKEKVAARLKKWNEENRDRARITRQTWREKNRPLHRAYASAYRALKWNAVPDFLRGCTIEQNRILDIYKLRELISKATGTVYHVDHMWPLAKGGPEWSGNLQIITAHENAVKQAKLCPELKRNIQQSLKELENDLHI